MLKFYDNLTCTGRLNFVFVSIIPEDAEYGRIPVPIYGFPAHSFCLSHKCSPLSVPYVWVGRGIRGVGMPTDGMAEQYCLFC